MRSVSLAAASLSAFTLVWSSVALADPPAAQADASTEGTAGRTLAGIVVTSIGGAAVVAGAAVLLYGAGLSEEPRTLPTQSAGVSTGRGFNAASSPAPQESEPTDVTPYDIGGALLVGGAITLGVGIVVLLTGNSSDQGRQPTARLAPARGGMRIRF